MENKEDMNNRGYHKWSYKRVQRKKLYLYLNLHLWNSIPVSMSNLWIHIPLSITC